MPSQLSDSAGVSGAATRRAWVPALTGLACALIGILDIVSAVTPEFHDRMAQLDTVVPGAVSHLAAAATAAAGVLLLVLAHGLRRRKVRAWRAVVGLLAASVVLHILKGLDVEEAVVAVGLLVVLVIYRRDFRAVGDPRTRWRAPAAFVGLSAMSVVVGVLMLQVRDHELVGPHSLGRQLRFVLEGLIGVTGPLHFAQPGVGDLAGDVLLSLGALSVFVTAYLVLRPAEPLPDLSAVDEARLRAMIACQGARDSLGYFSLRRDKSVVWSPSGKAAVSYRVVSGVMLASGDPIGDPEAWPGAICQAMALAAEHAWVPAVVGCSELAGTVWARHGLAALQLGDEALMDVASFSLDGRAMRNVRQAVNRVERAGYFVQIRFVRDIPADEREELQAQAKAWRGAETERGFSMALGRLGDVTDADCVAVLAYQEIGETQPLRGMLHFVPWGEDGLSLDLMVRDKDADNGLNEFLIVSMLQAAPGLGVRRVSLNFAAFRSALELGGRLGAGPILRAWRRILLFVSRWYQIESLYRFNAKFQPHWEPRFLCYRSVRDLPRVALAALEAEALWAPPRLPVFGAKRRAEDSTTRELVGAAR